MRHDGGMTEKPYRFVVTLNPAHRRKLAHLQVDTLTDSGRMATAADVIRNLIESAPLKERTAKEST